jgi:2,4-dienoyl-CoA reductase-like NADH-dependent reductase (Old Yellow Enzyme family)
VTDAVHARGGIVVIQLTHVGRIAHPDNKGGLKSVAPSAIQLDQCRCPGASPVSSLL